VWYTIDEHDKCVALEGIPRPSGGAPMPLVMADDDRLLVAYFVDAPWPPNPADETIAILQFVRPLVHIFGQPEHNNYDLHPLHNRGLSDHFYCEVKHSSWIRALRPLLNNDALEEWKHFVFLFHDSSLECVAQGFKVTPHRGSWNTVVQKMASMLCNVQQ
jgi:hypothetical protein